jgi:spore germination protein YaaH
VKCLDHVVPMAYDMTMREVGANAPLPAILDGVTRQYPALGIEPSRLVVALPWYAYSFQCSTATIGTNCSLPAGAKHDTKIWEMSYLQLGYGEVLDLHEVVGAPPVTYDHYSVFKWFDYVNASTKQRHRVSYDDADTLLVKYQALLRAGVAGVGAWTIAATQRHTEAATEAASRQMWAAVAHALQ